MLADILPTAYEVGVLNGRVRPGDVVAIVGAGPIGLSAILGSRLFSPSATSSPSIWLTAGSMQPSSLEQTSSSTTLERIPIRRSSTSPMVSAQTCRSKRSGSQRPLSWPRRSSVPVATSPTSASTAEPVPLHLEVLWTKDVTITTGLVDTFSTPTLLKLLRGGQIDVEQFVTHRFGMDQFIDAYDTFARASETGALKVILSATD